MEGQDEAPALTEPNADLLVTVELCRRDHPDEPRAGSVLEGDCCWRAWLSIQQAKDAGSI